MFTVRRETNGEKRMMGETVEVMHDYVCWDTCEFIVHNRCSCRAPALPSHCLMDGVRLPYMTWRLKSKE